MSQRIFSWPSEKEGGFLFDSLIQRSYTSSIQFSLFEAQVLRFTKFFFIYVFISFSGIDLDAAIRILEHIEDYSTISEPPVKPKGGEMFIYLPANTQEQGNLNFHVRRYQRCSECKVITDE